MFNRIQNYFYIFEKYNKIFREFLRIKNLKIIVYYF